MMRIEGVEIGPASIPRDIAGAVIIIAAILMLALNGMVKGPVALGSIMAVAGGLGIYRSQGGGQS